MNMNPIVQEYDADRGTTHMQFDGDDKKLSGEYFLWGGVCWPGNAQPKHVASNVGYICMLGWNIQEKRAYVLSTQQFQTIEHVYDHGEVAFHGLYPWFNDQWRLFFAQNYYYHCHDETHRMWLLQVLRCDMIQPHPVFAETWWQDEWQPLNIVFQWRETGRLRIRKEEKAVARDEDSAMTLCQELDMLSKTRDKEHISSSTFAVMCAVNGMANNPFRE